MRTSPLASEIRRLRRVVSVLDRRIAAGTLVGKVAEIDTAKRLARLEIGTDDDGEPVLGPWAQWEEAAVGPLSIHTPLKVGQQASYVSPSGVLGDGSTIRARAFDDDNGAPSQAADAAVIAYGAVTMTFSAGGVAIHGDVTVTGSFAAAGGGFEHEGVNVGVDHVHTQVVKGGDLSGPPE